MFTTPNAIAGVMFLKSICLIIWESNKNCFVEKKHRFYWLFPVNQWVFHWVFMSSLARLTLNRSINTECAFRLTTQLRKVIKWFKNRGGIKSDANSCQLLTIGSKATCFSNCFAFIVRHHHIECAHSGNTFRLNGTFGCISSAQHWVSTYMIMSNLRKVFVWNSN